MRKKIIAIGNIEIAGLYSPLRFYERLECGHIQKPPTDLYGDIHAVARNRCRKCDKGLPPDPQIEDRKYTQAEADLLFWPKA